MNEKAKKVSQSNSTNRGNDSKELEDLRVVAVKLYIKVTWLPKTLLPQSESVRVHYGTGYESTKGSDWGD